MPLYGMGIRLERGPGLNIMCTWKIWGRWTVMDFGKHTNYIWILTPRGTVGMLYVQPTFFVCVNKNSDGIAHPPVLPLKDHTENNRYYILSASKRYKSCNTPGSFCTDKPSVLLLTTSTIFQDVRSCCLCLCSRSPSPCERDRPAS